MGSQHRNYPKHREIRVKSLLNCPICGGSAIIRVVWGNRFTKCRTCKTRLFNHSATEKFGVADAKGFYYHINTVYIGREGDDDFDSLKLLTEMEGVRNEQRITESARKPREFEIRRRVFQTESI